MSRAGLYALYDLDWQRTLELQKRFGARHAFPTEEAFWKAGFDAVVICTPAPLHREHVLIAADHGKHVLCEKPLAKSAEDIEVMRDRMRDAGLLLATGFTYRFSHSAMEIRRLVREKAIGEVRALRLVYLWNLHGKWEWDDHGRMIPSKLRVARQCNIEDNCSGRFFEERFKLHRLESESDVLACMAYVDLNPLRAGMVDSLDDPAAQVSIGERLKGLEDQQVDPSSWLAPLELASEVDGQPVAVVNDFSAEEIERRRAGLSEKLGCLPMTLEAYCQLLWHLAIESRPELQSSPQLTSAQLRRPVWSSGKVVELDDVTPRMDQWSRQCDASVRGHACRATRRLQPTRPHAEGPPLRTSTVQS